MLISKKHVAHRAYGMFTEILKIGKPELRSP